MKPNHLLLTLVACSLAITPLARAADESADLAKQLNNPIADLISVPIQNNWDFGIGPSNATRLTSNVQPVIPFTLSSDVNLIVRTIVPVINADSPASGIPSSFGLGDISQSFFFAPSKGIGGWMVGAGPIFLYPSATDDVLGSGQWGAGPTLVVLKQSGGWTYGMLANHIFGFGGDHRHADINATFLQPFLAYTTESKTTFACNTEATRDWTGRQWIVPINVVVSQLVDIGGHPVQFGLGGRYYVDKPTGAPDWGIRFNVSFVFPK